VLRHYQGLKLREIAEVLEIPEGTVNSRLVEGLARLTRILEPQFDDQERRFRPGESGGPDHRSRPARHGANPQDRSSPASRQMLQYKTLNL